MARPKGSKNKVKDPGIDYALSIAEKQGAVDAITEEINALVANIDELKAQLKEKKKELKSFERQIATLEAKKEAADQKAAEEAKANEAIELVKHALAQGTTADEILELLK